MRMECAAHRLLLCTYQICEGEGRGEGGKVRVE